MTRQAFAFIIFSLFLIFGIKILSSNVSKVSKLPVKQLFLAGKTFSVELAQTDVELQKGLSGHKLLSNDQGMLFIFQKPDTYGFWMKDMTFPIDIIWIDPNFQIIHIEKSVSPETYPKIFYPETQASYILEILAGQVDTLKIKIGDAVTFQK